MKSCIIFCTGEVELKRAGLGSYDLINLSENPDFEFVPGVRYLVFGNDAYKIIEKRIHLGPRSEHFYECSKMPYLLTRSGIIFKFSYLNYRWEKQWIDKEQYELLSKTMERTKARFKDAKLATGISKKNNKPWYRFEYKVPDLTGSIESFLKDPGFIKEVPELVGYRIIRDNEMIDKVFDYFDEQEYGTFFGFDYETSGFPFDDPKFYHMGVGICSQDGVAAYFDIEWMTNVGGNLEYFKERLRKYLDKHGDNNITYNCSFEIRATYLLLHKMYMFQEGQTINKIDGCNERNFSLKYAAMKYCNVASWDDDFDKLQGVLWKLFKESTFDNFEDNPIWSQIVNDYPEEESEFKELFKRHWGDPFGCIPANILGKYCCLDAFYTVLLRLKARELGFSDLCWSTFNANMRMSAWLNINGVFIDKDKLGEMGKICQWHIAYGRLGAVNAFVRLKLNNMPKLPDTDIPEVGALISEGVNITDGKAVMTHYWKPDDPTGFNGKLMIDELGLELAMLIQDKYCKFHSVLDMKKQARGKKVFTAISDLLKKRWNYELNSEYCKFTVQGKEYVFNAPLKLLVKEAKMHKILKKCKEISSQMKLLEPKEFVMYRGEPMTVNKIQGWCDSVVNINSPDFKLDMAVDFNEVAWRILIDRHEHPENLVDNIKNGTRTAEYEWDYLTTPEIYKKCGFLREHDNLVKGLKVIRECIDTYKGPAADKIKVLSDMDRIGPGYFPFKFYMENYKFIKSLDYTGHEFTTAGYHTPVTPARIQRTTLNSLTNEQPANAAMFKSQGPNAMCFDPEGLKYFLEHFDEIDSSEFSIRGLAKFSVCYFMARKYFKSYGTYLNGMLVDRLRYTNMYDDNAVCSERWKHEPSENTIAHVYPDFAVMEKKSGRWASGFHTIPKITGAVESNLHLKIA